MALQVWLPLTRDANNQGLSNITAEIHGPTSSIYGKIGSCYEFDGSDDYISLAGEELYSIIRGGAHPMSFAFWVYHNDSTRGIIFGDYRLSGYIDFNIELASDHTIQFYWHNVPNKIFSGSEVALQGWTHIAITYDGTKVLIYKNGTLLSDVYQGVLEETTKVSGVYYLGRDSRTGTTALNGRLNDFRIYDHCLSPLEIKMISQALVVHYPLNREGFGRNNLATDTLKEVISKPYYATATDEYSADMAYIIWSGTSNIKRLSLPAGDLAQGDVLSISFDYEVFGNTKTSAYIYCQINGSAGSRNSLYPDSGNGSSSLYVKSKPRGKFFCTYTVSADQSNYTSSNPYIRARLRAATDGAYFKVWNLHVEKEGPSTSWCPCVDEDLYTEMGLNNGIIADVSGYKNNITSVENLTYLPDTPKYMMSAQFVADTHGAFTHPFTNGALLDEATFSCWVKRESDMDSDATGYIISGLIRIYTYSNAIRIQWFANNTDGSQANNQTWSTGYTPPLNEWTFITIVLKNSRMYFYANGVPAGNISSSRPEYIRANRGTRFGASTSTGTDGFPGKVSDIRIYSTALLEEEIMKLYNAPISLSNTGALLTSGEFEEE